MTTGHLIDTSSLSLYISQRGRQRAPALVERIDEIIEQEGLCIAHVVVYEIRRGLLAQELRYGGSHKKRARLERLLTTAITLGLDEPAGLPWSAAAELWARAQTQQPAITMSEADLLIATTAFFHERTLVTSDEALAGQLNALGFADDVELLPVR